MRGGSHAGEPDVRSAEGGATAPEALSAAAGPVVNRPSRSATGGATGSRLTLLHAERMMTVYPIVEIGTDHDYDHERPLCGMLFCERFVHWVRSQYLDQLGLLSRTARRSESDIALWSPNLGD